MLAVFRSEIGGDERSRASRALDNQNSLAPARDDAVPLRKGSPRGTRFNWELRYHGAVSFSDFLRKRHVLGRIELAETGAEHRNGSALCCERTLVGGGIDASCETGDNRKPRMSELE